MWKEGKRFIAFIVTVLAAVILVSLFLNFFGNYLVSKGYISATYRKVFGFILVLSLFFLALIFSKIRSKKASITEKNDDVKKLSPNGSFVIMIKPNKFKSDAVYKVFKKDYYLYFCRVGGQFYDINESVFNLTPEKDETELLSDKQNFKIELADIINADLSKKKSMWTGGIPNNGKVELNLTSRKEKFITHPVNDYNYLMNFLKKVNIQFVEKI